MLKYRKRKYPICAKFWTGHQSTPKKQIDFLTEDSMIETLRTERTLWYSVVLAPNF